MGLITKFVDVRVNAYTVNYYREKGYSIPSYINKKGELRMDTSKTFQVKIEDLPLKSHIIVQVKCDKCDEIIDVIYENYNNVINKHGKYLCTKCANREYNSGEKSSLWKPELTDEDRQHRRINIQYIDFKRAVLARDNYECQCCGSNKNLRVHHLDGYSWCVDKRYDSTNGITLCEICHKNFHSEYGYNNNTKEQFEEWFGNVKEIINKKIPVLPTCRTVYCYEDDMIYGSVKIASIESGHKSTSNINSVCNHAKGFHTAYGKHWFWYDEYINLTQEEIDKYINA